MTALYRAFTRARPVFFALMLVVGAPASAQEAAPAGDPFTIEGVAVDATASNAVKAREKALIDAQVKAFEQLADRTLSPEDRAAYTMPDADTIMALVKDFEITNEQLSATRYKGTFTVRFRPALAKQYLGAPAIQQAQDPAIIEAMPGQTVVTTTTSGLPGDTIAAQPVPAPAYQPPVMAGQSVTIRARFNTVQEWVRLKQSLERNRAFGVRRVVALRPREALVELAFNGTPAQLQQAIAGSGLSVFPAQSVAIDTQSPVLDVGFGGYTSPY